jgi:EAL domain-containing protein (putative c-di-GMP-specific phosphodiesterase class I)
LLQDTQGTLATLHQLRDLGIRIAMDDFGTGYSSLSYLRSFPFDKIKIDGSFVRELAAHGDSMAIVRAVTGLGTSMGISTTAEGVETGEQLALLRAEGCTEVQGYLLNSPRPSAEVEAMLACERVRGCSMTDVEWFAREGAGETPGHDNPLRIIEIDNSLRLEHGGG